MLFPILILHWTLSFGSRNRCKQRVRRTSRWAGLPDDRLREKASGNCYPISDTKVTSASLLWIKPTANSACI